MRLPLREIPTIEAAYNEINATLWKSAPHRHKGIDFAGVTDKTIISTCNGVVKVVAFDESGWGWYVTIQPEGETGRHLFCHLATGSIKVKQGQEVTIGDAIGTMGATGNVTGIHLHFQVNKADGTDVDPATVLGIKNQRGRAVENAPNPAPNPAPSTKVSRKGIDISYCQPSVDWVKVKSSGIEYAIIRTGFGKNASQKDSVFDKHMSGVQSVGLPYGFYHYSYADTVSRAREEAAFCLSLIKPYKPDYPVAIDIEDASISTLSVTRLTDVAIAFCEEVKKAGYKPAVYANANWFTNKLDANRIIAAGYDIWLAQYSTNPNYKGTYDMWQYSSTGKVDGITTNVDMNLCYKDYSPVAVTPVEPEPSVPLDNVPDSYAENAVRKAVERKILLGNIGGDFMLHSSVTRQDLLVMLDRAGVL